MLCAVSCATGSCQSNAKPRSHCAWIQMCWSGLRPREMAIKRESTPCCALIVMLRWRDACACSAAHVGRNACGSAEWVHGSGCDDGGTPLGIRPTARETAHMRHGGSGLNTVRLRKLCRSGFAATFVLILRWVAAEPLLHIRYVNGIGARRVSHRAAWDQVLLYSGGGRGHGGNQWCDQRHGC